MKQNIKKDFVWNTIGTLVNSLTSLAFLIIVTRINGTDIAGIFTFAFSLACLFQVIANYSGRTFQVTNTNNSITNTDFIYHRYITSWLMIICILIYLLFENYSLTKMLTVFLLVIFRFIESICDCFYGIIQKNDRLYKVGISLLLKGVFGIATFLIVDYITKDFLISIIGLILINILVILFYDCKNYKEFYKKEKVKKSSISIIFKTGFFVFAVSFLSQYLLNAPKYAIDDFLNNNSQTIYGIISMPATVLTLCCQFVIQPLLLKITKYIKQKDFVSLEKMSFKVILFVILIGTVGEVCCYFVGIPFLELIYGISLKKHLLHLLIIILGATCCGIVFVVSSILIALRKNSYQMLFYIISSLFTMAISKILVANFGLLGACLSYTITMIILCAMYICYFIYIIQKLKKQKIISKI